MYQLYTFISLDDILWYVAIALLFLSFIFFLLKAIKIEIISQKRVYLGYGLFLLLFGFTRLFFLFSWRCGNAFEGCQYFYLILGYLVGTFGLIIIIFLLETYLLKTRKILTSITIILFCIILIILFGFPSQEGREFALMMTYILLPIVIVTISISYIYLIIQSSGLSRKKAIGAFIGLFLISIGHLMNTSFFYSILPGAPGFLAPIVMIMGVAIFLTTQLLIK